MILVTVVAVVPSDPFNVSNVSTVAEIAGGRGRDAWNCRRFGTHDDARCVQNMINDGNRMKNENDGQDAHHGK